MTPENSDGEMLPPQRISPQRWPLATHLVTRSTEAMDEYDRDQCRWLQSYALSSNMTPAEISARVLKLNGDPYSPDSIYQLLTGKRTAEGASVRPITDAIARLRRTVGEVEARASTQFIETPMTRRMFRIFRRTMELHRIAFIYGLSQIGKTTAGVEFQRQNNHGRTFILRMPTGGTMGDIYSEFAVRLGVSAKRRVDDLRRKIIDSFDEHNLIIVDEAHQCLLGRYSDSGVKGLEFLREIHDRRKCGLVLLGTDVLREGLQNHRVLGQLWKRRSPGLVMQLPSKVPAADLNVFAQAFGLEPAPDREIRISLEVEEKTRTFSANPYQLQNAIVKAESLGSWIRLLEDARDHVRDVGGKMSWGKVLAAYCQAQAMENPGGEQ